MDRREKNFVQNYPIFGSGSRYRYRYTYSIDSIHPLYIDRTLNKRKTQERLNTLAYNRLD